MSDSIKVVSDKQESICNCFGDCEDCERQEECRASDEREFEEIFEEIKKNCK